MVFGRGRGKSNSSINVISDALGIGRGDIDNVSAPINPPELYPPLTSKPLPLEENSRNEYIIALKQEFRNYMKDSPYNVRPETSRSKIERYSDKFKKYNSHRELDWIPNWNLYPSELRMKTSKSAKRSEIKPRMVGKRTDHSKSDLTLMKKLDKHHEAERLTTDKGAESEDEMEVNVFEPEEDVEEDLDYCQNYYDDDYNAFDDDADDGPTF